MMITLNGEAVAVGCMLGTDQEFLNPSVRGGGFVEEVTRRIVGNMVTIITASGVSITGVPRSVRSFDGALTLDMGDASLPFSSIRLLCVRT